MAKQQSATALSSCEAELYALQSVSQESVCRARLIQRIATGLTWQHEDEVIPVVLESDSESAIQLVHGMTEEVPTC